jgi:hypothetical protein
LREKVARGRIALRLANLPPCLIGIEAGMATHYVARELAALGAGWSQSFQKKSVVLAGAEFGCFCT